MTEDPSPRLQQALAAIGDVAVSHGFTRFTRTEWTRGESWKTDAIRVDLHVFDEFLVSFQVALVPEDVFTRPNADHMSFAFGNLPKILGRENVYWRPPFLRFRRTRFLRKLKVDLEAGLKWFDRFDAPVKCLQELDACLNPGSEAHTEAELCLQTLMKQERNPAA